jgi:hypothetical protein
MPSFPNRCQHIKVNGTQCGCPALRRNQLCYFHKRHHDERVQLNLDRLKDDRLKDDRTKDDRTKDARLKAPRRRPISIDLPVLEDANSIQVSLMQIMRLIITGQLDAKTAGLLLYALQTASANLGRTSFEPNRHYVVLDLNTVDETALGEPVWADSDFEEEDDEEDDDEEVAEEVAEAAETTRAANPQPAAKKPVASKTREQWRAEVEAERNATLPIAPFSTHCNPEPAPRSEIRQ